MTHILKHEHLILRADIMNPFNDTELCNAWVQELIKKIDMEIMMGPYTAYCNDEGNQGMTTVTVIKTSHIALHIWDRGLDYSQPQEVPAQLEFDVYSCKSLDIEKVLEHIQVLKPVRVVYKFLDREKDFEELMSSRRSDDYGINPNWDR